MPSDAPEMRPPPLVKRFPKQESAFILGGRWDVSDVENETFKASSRQNHTVAVVGAVYESDSGRVRFLD